MSSTYSEKINKILLQITILWQFEIAKGTQPGARNNTYMTLTTSHATTNVQTYNVIIFQNILPNVRYKFDDGEPTVYTHHDTT